MPVLKNRAYVSTTTTGTGTITLGSPVSGYQSFADAGVANGNSVRYTIEDGANFEIGTGTYTASGTTLSRTPSESSNSGSAINLSGSARVFITAAAEDIPFFYAEQVGSTSVAPTVSNNDAIAIGDNASATETNAIALSSNASATSASSVALGMNSSASGLSGGFAGQTALGNNSVAYDPSGGTFNQTALTKSYAAGQSSFAAAIDRNTSTYGALGAYSVAIGRDSTANNTGSMAIGYQASASTDYLIALGGTSNQVKVSGAYTLPTADGTANQVLTTDGSGAVTFADAGGGADLYAANESSPSAQPSATGSNAIAIGDSTTSSGTSSVAIGFAADASNTHNIAIGYNSEASTGTYNFAFGSGARANASYYAVAIGQTAGGLGSQAGANGSFAAAGGVTATGNNSIALGYSYASGTSGLAAAIVNNTSSYGATGANSIAMGYRAKASHSNSTSIGRNSSATNSDAVALGNTATASGSGGLALGVGANVAHSNSVALGTSVSTTAANQVSIGSTSDTVRISETYTLPTSDGTNGQVLTTDGSGAVTFADAGGGASAYTIDAKTSAYTVVAGDLGKIINCTSGTFTLTLTAAATLGAGFNVYLWNTGTGAITIDGNASETIDGATTYILRQNEGTEIVCDGSNFSTGAKKTMRGYAENIPSTYGKPVASGAGAIALGNRNGDAVYLSQAIGTRSFAVNGYATSNYSTAIGQNSTGGGAEAVTGAGAMALGGSSARGTASFAAAIDNNSSTYGAQGANSIAMGYLSKATGIGNVNIGYEGYATGGSGSVAIGYRARATGTNAICLGQSGYSTASGAQSLAIGYSASATATHSMAIGRSHTIQAQYATAIGGRNSEATSDAQYGIVSGYEAKIAQYGKGAHASGSFAASGDAQGGQFILRADTTDATATVLTTNNSTAASTNQIVAASDTCITFDGTITAMQNGAQAYASWKIEGLLVNDGGTTTLANSATTVISNADGWGMALSADNTNNALAITCTGEASHNIRWVANIRTTEVTYA